MQIAIPDEVTDTLRAKARAVNLDAAEYAVQILREQLTPPNKSQLSLMESELLQLINHGFSDDVWQRFHELNEKRKDEFLTPEEYEELSNSRS